MDSTVVYIADRLESGIKTLAQEMSVPAQKVWDTLIYQVWLEGILSAVCLCLFLSLFACGVWIYRKYGDVGIPFGMVGGAGTVVSLVAFLAEGVTKILNPEYFAIMEIAKVFGRMP